MRFAVLSDVHGNRLALEAVLEDVDLHSVDAVLCLGDHVSGPLDPAGAADRLMQISGPIIAGNHDRWVLANDENERDRIDRFARSRLTGAHLDWLTAMPATALFNGEVFMCHGTPASDTEVWLDNFWHDRKTTLPSEASIVGHAEGIQCPIILCGHTHIARSVRLRDGRLIINPGSVGLQLVHGSPDARYAIVERRNGKWSTSIRVVEYDHHGAARQAQDNGFDQWGPALSTGWANPEGLF